MRAEGRCGEERGGLEAMVSVTGKRSTQHCWFYSCSSFSQVLKLIQGVKTVVFELEFAFDLEVI